jgi:AbrB family looped-hinge helix DNA binding protein
MISATYQKEVIELKDGVPSSLEEQFFGSVTVGERGQVVIPVEARKRLEINPGEKLLVMGHPFAAGLVLVKIDSMREFLSTFLEGLRGIEASSEEHHDGYASSGGQHLESDGSSR